ncbi:MAG: hypothetical protein GXP49_05065 [Deltaproteobacteria bacterium]|nr:hypothetical protein [Deltaproteobacteria bacterium]
MVSMARRLTFKELTVEDEHSSRRGMTIKGLLVTMLVIGVLLALGLIRVWTRTEMVRMGFDLRKAGENQRALVIERDTLRRELAALKTPSRVERIARKELGMREPGPDQIIELGKK